SFDRGDADDVELHSRGVSRPDRRREDDVLRPGGNVALHVLGAAKDARALEDDVDIEVPPRKPLRLTLAKDLDPMVPDRKPPVLHLDRVRIAAVDRVVTKEIGEILRIDEVVDRDELELAMIDDLLEQSATDAPHAVDGDSHSRVLLSRAADVVLEPAGSGLSATQEHPLGHGCKGVAKRACRRTAGIGARTRTRSRIGTRLGA